MAGAKAGAKVSGRGESIEGDVDGFKVISPYW
jgi:hypothetical protein